MNNIGRLEIYVVFEWNGKESKAIPHLVHFIFLSNLPAFFEPVSIYSLDSHNSQNLSHFNAENLDLMTEDRPYSQQYPYTEQLNYCLTSLHLFTFVF